MFEDIFYKAYDKEKSIPRMDDSEFETSFSETLGIIDAASSVTFIFEDETTVGSLKVMDWQLENGKTEKRICVSGDVPIFFNFCIDNENDASTDNKDGFNIWRFNIEKNNELLVTKVSIKIKDEDPLSSAFGWGSFTGDTDGLFLIKGAYNSKKNQLRAKMRLVLLN